MKPTRLALPADVRDEFHETLAAIRFRSTIVWEEHCSECAFPSCYGSCAFYAPRQDYHCRRFARGIEPVRDGSAKLQLSRIQFRRWGKLEGWGPVGMKPRALEETIARTAKAAAGVLRLPLPRRMIEFGAACLDRLRRVAARKGAPPGESDVFIVEAWNQNRAPQPFTLTFVTAGAVQPKVIRFPLSFAPGYSRTAVPAPGIARHIDLTKRFRIQIEPMTEGAPPLIFGIADFVRMATAVRSPDRGELPKAKCVVWDLDNTLWQGILAEDGVEGVTPIPAAIAGIVELDRRGILNSVASKNDPELAKAALERFGLIDYFVAPEIGWGPKSEAVGQIAAALNIGMDTLVLIDDQAFERGEVEALCPGVEAFPFSAITGLAGLERFAVPVTAEGSKRRLMYQVEERRQRESASSRLDYDAFLRSCDIRVDVRRLGTESIKRVFELSQRTNQLNISGRRYAIEEIESLIKSPRGRHAYVLGCTDRFGDYGVIGFSVVNRSTALVESFFLSCRVQRKRIENAFFARLSGEVAAAGHAMLRVAYRQTDRNHAAVQMLNELGFDYLPSGAAHGEFRRAVERPFEHSRIVELNVPDDNMTLRASA